MRAARARGGHARGGDRGARHASVRPRHTRATRRWRSDRGGCRTEVAVTLEADKHQVQRDSHLDVRRWLKPEAARQLGTRVPSRALGRICELRLRPACVRARRRCARPRREARQRGAARRRRGRPLERTGKERDNGDGRRHRWVEGQSIIVALTVASLMSARALAEHALVPPVAGGRPQQRPREQG